MDNIKSLLIFLVILGHLIEASINYKPTLKSIYIAIYSFHMPLFIFITGYFAKLSKKPTKFKVKKAFITYILAQIIYSLFYIYIIRIKGFRLNFVYPNFIMWYLQALIIWYILSDYFNGFLKSLSISIVLAILVGLDTSIFTYLSLSRVIAFLPFFIAGYFFKYGYIEKLYKYKYIIAFASIIIIFMLLKYSKYIDVMFLYSAHPYSQLKVSLVNGMLFRILFFIVAAVLSSFIIIMTPKNKNIFSIFGRYTLTLYLVHPAIIQLMGKCKLLKFVTKIDVIKTVLLGLFLIYFISILFTYTIKYLKKIFSTYSNIIKA